MHSFGPRGSIRLGSWDGAPIYVHWSAAIGMVLFGALAPSEIPLFAPGAWLGYFLVVLVHEIGHAGAVQYCGSRVTAIRVTTLGGECQYQDFGLSAGQQIWIAWAGVIAQLALATLIVVAVRTSSGGPYTQFAGELMIALTFCNVLVAALNLIPIRGLDGVVAWKVVPYLWNRWRPR